MPRAPRGVMSRQVVVKHDDGSMTPFTPDEALMARSLEAFDAHKKSKSAADRYFTISPSERLDFKKMKKVGFDDGDKGEVILIRDPADRKSRKFFASADAQDELESERQAVEAEKQRVDRELAEALLAKQDAEAALARAEA